MFLKGHKEDTEEIAINTQSDSIYVDFKAGFYSSEL
jgi:hypothetical protein